MKYTSKFINEILMKAGRFDNRIIGIYAADNKPDNAVVVSAALKGDGNCVAKAIVAMAMDKDIPGVYTGGEALKDSCWASASWLGYKPMPDITNYMLSTGEGTGRDGFYIKDNPELCRESMADMGNIKPVSEYILAMPCGEATDDEGDLLAVVCLGDSEQIRIMSGLIHFGERKIFSPVVAAWGSGCANFISYPLGLTENCPKDTSFISPIGHEANTWFPKDMLAISIPISVVEKIIDGYDRSFAAKHPELTYPER